MEYKPPAVDRHGGGGDDRPPGRYAPFHEPPHERYGRRRGDN